MEARLLPGRRRKRSFAVLLGAALAAAVVVTEDRLQTLPFLRCNASAVK